MAVAVGVARSCSSLDASRLTVRVGHDTDFAESRSLEDRDERVGLISSDLEEHVPPVTEPRPGPTHCPSKHGQAVVTPIEGGGRFEGTHVAGQVLSLIHI